MPTGSQRAAEAPLAEERPELLLFCDAAGLIGNLAPIAAMFAASAVAEHDLIADTVSDLARGPHKWIMDTAFYVNAAGLLGLAIAAAHVHLGRAAWSVGILCLGFLAMTVILLGVWDDLQTSGGGGGGMTVHTRLTFLLGPLYLAGPLLMARGAARVRRRNGPLFVASAAIWLVAAAAFKFAPTAYDGLLEKIALAGTLLWTLPLSLLFLRWGRAGVAAEARGG